MRRSAFLFIALAVAATLVPVAAPADPACDWPMFGHDPGHSFAQADGCAAINPTNVSTLKPKWFKRSDVPVTASPTVVDGVVYVGDWNGTFMALNTETGHEIWSFQSEDQHNVAFGKIVSSAAVDIIDPPTPAATPIRVVLFASGATLYALDPANGALLAKVDVDPRTEALKATTANAEIEIESSPVVGHFGPDVDRIFVGMDVHNDRNIGRTGLLSFELKKDNATAAPTPYRFELKYKFDPEREVLLQGPTALTDGSGTGYGCGGVWSSPMLDQTSYGSDGLIVFGTSNCVHNEAAENAGENSSEGVFAIGAKSGALKWKYRPRGVNPYDDDFGASPNALPGGLVGAGGKDGVYYAFPRVGTGVPAWTSHLGQAGHLTDQFAFGGMIGTPAVGKVEHPLTGETPAIFAATALSSPIGEPIDTSTPDQWLDQSLAEDPGRMFSLHAISAVDGKVLWRTPLSRQAFGAPTYANGVVFVPSTFDFSVKAFHADTGALLWQHLLNGPPSSPPAIVGDSIYMGTGTSANGLPLDRLSGIWSFELATSMSVPTAGAGVLLSAQNNQLDHYTLGAPVPAATRTTPIKSHAHDPNAAPGTDGTPENGNDSNGQICRFKQANGETRYLLGEDTDQAQLPNGTAQGWGIYDPTGGAAGPWTLVDKIVAPYRLHDNSHLPDNTGCAVSADGTKLFLVDLGVGAFDVPGVGSLFMYTRDANGNFSSSSPVCVLANDLTTAGYIATHPDGSVLVPESGRSSGGSVSRFSPPFPASGDTTACTTYRNAHTQDDRENFLAGFGPFPDVASFVPISIARRNGNWLVGNVVPGQVSEYDDEGNFIRPVLLGQGPGVAGITVDPNGNLYVANLGLVPCDSILCPADGAGQLWKVSFDPIADTPLPPVVLNAGLTFPEGLSAFPSL